MLVGMAVGAFALAGCAESQPRQNIGVAEPRLETLIETVPEASRCRAVGVKGRQDARESPIVVPGPPLGYPIRVSCGAAGHFDATMVLHPPMGLSTSKEPQITMVERLAQGAGVTVMADRFDPPNKVVIRMRRATFETAVDREAFYDDLKTRHTGFWAGLRNRVLSVCEDGALRDQGTVVALAPVCRAALNNLDRQAETDLREIEISRRRATFK